MATDEKAVEVSLDNGILRVTINRPERLNAMTTDALTELADAFASHAGDPAVRVAVVRGAGRAFCTGADIADGGGSNVDASAEPSPDRIDAFNHAVDTIRRFPTPVVAALHGPAAGAGVPLALACDLVVAAESSYLLLAFTRIGLMPDAGATALVAASVGRARAMQLALLADRLPATEALAANLIAAVHPDDVFDAELQKLLDRLAAGPTSAYASTKAAINDATLDRLDDAFATERAGQLTLLASDDFAEGVAAFREKRPARFGQSVVR